MIISLADLKTYLGITGTAQDARLQFIVDGVNAEVNKRTGRVWGETETIVDEIHDYEPVIFLCNLDVTDVSAVKLGRGTNQTTLDADTYRWNGLGRLVLDTDSEDFVQNVDDYDELAITYTHGTATAPDDLVLAALQLGGHMNRSINGEVTEESVGSFRKKYAAENSTTKDILDSYRKRRM